MREGMTNMVRGLYAIIDTSLVLPSAACEVAAELLESGITILQLRAKGLGSGEFLLIARRLRAMTTEKGVLFIVNDRVDIALVSRADGVHLGQTDIPVEDARKLLGSDRLIGISTHNLAQAKEADGSGADYVSFGPVFATATKVKAGPALGIAALKEARCLVNKKLVAIGGINEVRLPQILACDVDSIAVISNILKSKNPGEKAKEIISLIGKTPV